MSRENLLFENSVPAVYESASKGTGGYHILGKLKAPFFDLNNATRNGRYYGEAAEDALNSDDFKEKIENRVFFGRLGHPMTEEEAIEDPAVRACVVLTEYNKNPQTNMYEGTLEILDNQYGRQLKSLIDAGCIMGVSTRGSGDSYEAANGSETIVKGSYEFEALDVVTMPAVKAARVTVMESYDKSKRKKLEELIESSNDKVMLESLKVTVESSNLPNKANLLESINKKLSGGVETIESLANDILMVSEKLAEAEAKNSELTSKLSEALDELNNYKSSTGTTENDSKKVSESKLIKLLRTSTQLVEEMKVEISKRDKKLESISKSSADMIESLKAEVKSLRSTNESLIIDNKGLMISNSRLVESCDELSRQLESKVASDLNSKKLNESLTKSDKTIASLRESLSLSESKFNQLKQENQKITSSYAGLRSKYVESVAVANGISLEALKSRINEKSSIQMIESAAKSIREEADKRNLAIPDVMELGKKLESSQIPSIDNELDAAGRVAAALAGKL